MKNGQRQDQIKLALMMQFGLHQGGWRHPSAYSGPNPPLKFYADMARKLEQGRFDILFWADSLSLSGDQPDTEAARDAVRRTHPARIVEPYTVLSAIAALTEHLGLVCTASTTFHEPFHIARWTASLDHLSGGRAGWNVVTSQGLKDGLNFSRDVPVAHADRYDRAREFVQVVKGLWDTIDDGAVVRDKESGVCLDDRHVHRLDHKGRHFSVRGPLNVTRSPQGCPVVFQAGASADGLDLAAQTADVVFTAQSSLTGARAFHDELKERVRRAGRPPDAVKVMTGIMAFVAPTGQGAWTLFDEMQALVQPEVGLHALSRHLGGFDLAPYPIDGPLPEDIPQHEGGRSRMALIRAMAKRENLTIRQTYQRVVAGNGHDLVIGSPSQVADHMQGWFEARVTDGFMLLPHSLPTGVTDFVDLVVPELQRRGIFRTEYESVLLRDNLGLPHPANRFAIPDQARRISGF